MSRTGREVMWPESLRERNQRARVSRERSATEGTGMSSISYTREGSGPPVVLIHGIGHRREAWGKVAIRLAESHEVIAVDLPGHGRSPRPVAPHGYRMASVADQLEELFAELGLDHPHVAGNSLGGYLALELAQRGSVRSATAISPAGFWNAVELWGILGPQLVLMKASSHAPDPVVKLFADRLALRRISMRALYTHPERLSAEVALGDTYNLRRTKGFWPCFLSGIALRYDGAEPTVPVTIAWGDHDRLLIPRQAKRAAARLPGARQVSLVDCGHVPMVDDADQVTDVVREQIAAVEAGAVVSAAS